MKHAPHAHEIDYKIIGNDMQFVEIELDPQEAAIGEPGAMMFMEEGIQMSTKMSDGSKHGSGFLGSLVGAAKRNLAGEDAFLVHFKNVGQGKKKVAFSAPYPGQIIAIDLGSIPSHKVICQKEAFLCAAQGISLNIAFTRRLGAAWAGGEDFMMQAIEGDGFAFIHAGGTIIEKTLDNSTIYVDTGSIVGFESGIDFDVQVVKGMKNMMFGGEDMFLSTLSGTGKIWLQSMPYQRFVSGILGGGKN